MFFSKTKKSIGFILALSIVLGFFVFNPETVNADSGIQLGKTYSITEADYKYQFDDYCAAFKFIPSETGFYLVNAELFLDAFYLDLVESYNTGFTYGEKYLQSVTQIEYFNLPEMFDPIYDDIYYMEADTEYYFVHSKGGCYGCEYGDFCIRKIEEYVAFTCDSDVYAPKDSTFTLGVELHTTIDCENVTYDWRDEYGWPFVEVNSNSSSITLNSNSYFSEDDFEDGWGRFFAYCFIQVDYRGETHGFKFESIYVTPCKSVLPSGYWAEIVGEKSHYAPNYDYSGKLFTVSAGASDPNTTISYQWFKRDYHSDEYVLIPGKNTNQISVADLGDPVIADYEYDDIVSWYFLSRDVICLITFTNGDEVFTQDLQFGVVYGVDNLYSGTNSIEANYGDTVTLPANGNFSEPSFIEGITYSYEWYSFISDDCYYERIFLGTGKTINIDTSELNVIDCPEGCLTRIYCSCTPYLNGKPYTCDGELYYEYTIYYPDFLQQMSSGIAVNEDNFPDANFRNYVSETFDKDGDGYLNSDEIQNAERIDVSNKNIRDLTGIEYFLTLSYLNCYDNNLTTLDVSKNVELLVLSCGRNKLTSLDVSNNSKLVQLYCSENHLTSLDLCKNTGIIFFDCYDNHLTSLDVSMLSRLNILHCANNELTTLDLSKNVRLMELNCWSNQLNELDLYNNEALIYLDCRYNQLTTLDLRNNKKLYFLSCCYNQLTSLDVSMNEKITELYCYNNALNELDVSNISALSILGCNDNQLKKLDLSSNSGLTEVNCRNNQLTSLDLSNSTSLDYLDCQNNKLTSLDVSNNILLKTVYCQNNQITSLEVFIDYSIESSICPELRLLDCSNNSLTSLNLFGCAKLRELYCYNNALNSLELLFCNGLYVLQCYSNSLTSLELWSCTYLCNLNCRNNDLTEINISKCIVDYIYVYPMIYNHNSGLLYYSLVDDGAEYYYYCALEYDNNVKIISSLNNIPITLNPVENGTATLSKTKADYGDEIVVTCVPDEGYELDTILVDDTAIEGNSFIMPYQYTTVTVTFRKTLTINEQPSNYIGLEGTIAKFNVVAEGDDLKYQWQLKKGKTSWANLSSGGANTSTLSIKADDSKNGKVYRCVITDSHGKTIITDEVSVTIKEPAIKINTQPESYSGVIGSTAKFTVDAEGDGLTYQWQLKKGKSWADLTTGGATTTALSIKVDAAKNGKVYRCLITDENGEQLASDEVTITVTEPSIKINSQPVSYSGVVGSTAKFTVAAEGEGLTYQWQLKKGSSWSNLSSGGATTPTLSIKVDASKNGKVYRCLISGGNNEQITSNEVTITVTEPTNAIVINTQPSNYVGLEGSTAKFTVAAEGVGLTYQWQLKKGSSWANLSSGGATTTTLSVKADASKNGKIYRCLITDADGNELASEGASITIKEPSIFIDTQPEDYSGAVGTTAKFTVEARGEGLTYQWQLKKGSKWADLTSGGATTDTLSIKVDSGKDGKVYRCLITDANGEELASEEVTIHVTVQPVPSTASSEPAPKSAEAADTVEEPVSVPEAPVETPVEPPVPAPAEVSEPAVEESV